MDFILSRIVPRLSAIGGVEAVVLGGSRARGWHDEHSDIDFGLYTRGELDIAALNALCAVLDDERRDGLASPRGGWGEWVDGGAWLTVGGVAVDLIYRDLARVEAMIEEARAGRFRVGYSFGHPHGFVSAYYAGEVAISQPLHDPHGTLAALKAKLTPYPEALRAALMRVFLEEARFTLAMVEKGAKIGDTVYCAGAAFRIAAALAQAIFAANRQWLINEKRCVPRAGAMASAPRDFAARLDAVFAAPLAAGPLLAALIAETETACA